MSGRTDTLLANLWLSPGFGELTPHSARFLSSHDLYERVLELWGRSAERDGRVVPGNHDPRLELPDPPPLT
jgi:hypothetical protein